MMDRHPDMTASEAGPWVLAHAGSIRRIDKKGDDGMIEASFVEVRLPIDDGTITVRHRIAGTNVDAAMADAATIARGALEAVPVPF
jgi:hypothetical protein